jgi:hypothetical protein
MATFSAQVGDWVAKSETLLTGVIQESAQRVFNEARLPVAQGGRMRVDTGFLRNSATAAIDSIPSGPSSASEGEPAGGDAQITLTIAKFKPGSRINMVFTANYALARESKDAFVRMAAQRWQDIVREVTSELKQRAGK